MFCIGMSLKVFHILECKLICSNVSQSLTGLQPTEKMWGSVFGGGTKQLVRVTAMSSPLSQTYSPAEFGPSQPSGPAAAAAAAVDVVQQRVRLHIKLLQQIGTPAAAGGGSSSTPSNFLFLC